MSSHTVLARTRTTVPVYSTCSTDPANLKVQLMPGVLIHVYETQLKVDNRTLQKTVGGWVLVQDGDECLVDLCLPECPICLDGVVDDMKMPCCEKPIHKDCFQMQLQAKWTGKMISFGFTRCPLCLTDTMGMPTHRWPKEIQTIFKEISELKQQVKFLTERQDSEVPEEERGGWAFFECTQCEKPFCGGKVSCAEEHDLDAQEMVCGECKWQAKAQDHRCMEHGKKYAMFKCDSCCNIATFDCISNHYCEDCHRRPGAKKFIPCPGEGKCPLGMPHPANHTAMHGRERTMGFVLGCFKCFDPNYEPLHYYTSGPDPFKEADEDNNKGQKFEALFSYKKEAVCVVIEEEEEKVDVIPQAPEPAPQAEEPVIPQVAPEEVVIGAEDPEAEVLESDDDSESLEEDLDLQRQVMIPNISNASDGGNGLNVVEGFFQDDREEVIQVLQEPPLLAPPRMIPVAS